MRLVRRLRIVITDAGPAATPSPKVACDEEAAKRRRQILSLLEGGQRLRAPGIAAAMGCSLSSVKRELDALKAEGIIRFEGPSKNGGYRMGLVHRHAVTTR